MEEVENILANQRTGWPQWMDFDGQAGASFVSYRHTSFLKNHSQQNNFIHYYEVRGHTSFLVSSYFMEELGTGTHILPKLKIMIASIRLRWFR
jgi:hypothetical protein